MEYAGFLKEVRERHVPYGSAVLWWLGQMGLWIKMGDTVLSIDYYADPLESRLVKPPVPASEVDCVSVFLGTHDHIDHIDRPSWKIWAETCPEAGFVGPEFHRAGLIADGIPQQRFYGLTDGSSLRFGDITVHAIAAAHEFLDQDEKSGLYPYLQYVIEGSGLRIYHAGDTLRYEGMLGKLQKLGRIDAALLPINGRDGKRYRSNLIGNMTFQEAADLAGELHVRTVIPGHFDMFEGNTANPMDFEDYLDAKYPGQMVCRIPKYLEPMELHV